MRTRRPRPSYKKLYEGLLKSIASTNDEPLVMSDQKPTHVLEVTETIHWYYEFVSTEEDADSYEGGSDTDRHTTVRQYKTVGNIDTEIRPI